MEYNLVSSLTFALGYKSHFNSTTERVKAKMCPCLARHQAIKTDSSMHSPRLRIVQWRRNGTVVVMIQAFWKSELYFVNDAHEVGTIHEKAMGRNKRTLSSQWANGSTKGTCIILNTTYYSQPPIAVLVTLKHSKCITVHIQVLRYFNGYLTAVFQSKSHFASDGRSVGRSVSHVTGHSPCLCQAIYT
jgi:hypothetical protein